MITSLHLSTAKSWRGGENQLYLLARGLKQRGERAIVLAPEGTPLLERCLKVGLECRAMRLRGELDIFGALRLASLIRKEKPDILHLHDGHAVLPGKFAAWGSGRKNLKVFAHRRTVFKIKGRGKYSGRVDRVIAISGAVKAELLKAGVAPERVRVVFSGMDFPETLPANSPEVQAFRKEWNIPEGAFLIAHAAALTSEKRQHDILEALGMANRTLKARGLPGVHLAFAGSGVLDGALRSAAVALGVDSQVHFLGFQTDLRPLWGAAAMAIYASEAEGLCTALIEAQGAGLPAAISRAGGMTEVVEEGETGVIFDIGDTQTLSQSILAWREDDAVRGRMGEKPARARALFSAEAMVDGILKAYKDALHNEV